SRHHRRYRAGAAWFPRRSRRRRHAVRAGSIGIMTRHADAAPRVHAVVPVKRLSGAKSRLATGLDRPQREELVLAMLTDTLRALSGSPLVCGLTVVTPDARAAAAATRCGAAVLDERTALTHPSARRGRSTPPPP